MKTNFKHDNNRAYQVGDIIRGFDDVLHLVAENEQGEYILVDLTHNTVSGSYITLKGLKRGETGLGDVLTDAEINEI